MICACFGSWQAGSRKLMDTLSSALDSYFKSMLAGLHIPMPVPNMHELDMHVRGHGSSRRKPFKPCDLCLMQVVAIGLQYPTLLILSYGKRLIHQCACGVS